MSTQPLECSVTISLEFSDIEIGLAKSSLLVLQKEQIPIRSESAQLSNSHSKRGGFGLTVWDFSSPTL